MKCEELNGRRRKTVEHLTYNLKFFFPSSSLLLLQNIMGVKGETKTLDVEGNIPVHPYVG